MTRFAEPIIRRVMLVIHMRDLVHRAAEEQRRELDVMTLALVGGVLV